MPARTLLPFKISFSKDSERKNKPKSTSFLAIEAALDKYLLINSRPNLLILTDALAGWKRSKGANGAWKQSIRFAEVDKLSEWLIQESLAIGIFPTSRPLWNNNHNCYAYAMLCYAPIKGGNNARPGKHAGAPKNIPDHFAEGIMLDYEIDHEKSGRQVKVLDIKSPTKTLSACSAGHYLAAMITCPTGYHFYRRNESTGLWSHKNASFGPVETYYYDNTKEKPLAITDEVLAEMMQPTGMWTFKCYLEIPKEGVNVEG
ncbi:MAG: hypothetical protein JWQ40_1580 [Segetibacter sp.]|nr:hypothetical protein [Segetibacter sp.]